MMRLRTRCNIEGRICTKCYTYKPWSMFGFQQKGVNGHTAACRDCEQKRSAKWCRINVINAAPNEFENRLREQGGKCAICGIILKLHGAYNDSACLDHCHVTHKIRGILCRKCNLGLGDFKDSLGILLKAVEYKRKHS